METNTDALGGSGAPDTLTREELRARRHRAQAAEEPRSRVRAVSVSDWRVVPLLAVSAAAGLFAIAVADTGARFGAWWAEPFFWFGILTLYVPPVIAIILPDTGRHERLGAIVLLAMGLFLVKVLHSPTAFAFGDEFAHYRTAADILASGHLFTANPLSIVSPAYPGLELSTAALVSLTGLPIHAAGIVVLGVGRLLLALALYLILETLTRSSRIAALAAVIYTANPNFTFWSAQYAYESLALPVAMAIVYLAIRRARGTRSRSLDVVMVLAAIALVPTHHLTSYALAAFFAAWAAVAFILERRGGTIVGPPRLLLLGLPVAAILWVAAFARVTIRYLAPVIGGALTDAYGFVLGSTQLKTFFRGDPTLVSPPAERVVAFLAVGLLAITLGAALVRWFRHVGAWPRFRSDAVAWTFALGGIAWYPIQAVRAIQSGTEISNRAGEFLYLPIGFLIALAVRHFWLGHRPNELRTAATAALAIVIFAGGVIIGMPRWARMPGPYLVSGDTRAIQPESLTASAWFRATYGTGQKVVADQTNELIMGSSGGQDMIHGTSFVFFSEGLGRQELGALAREDVRFVVVDRRLASMIPVVGYYFEPGEPQAGRHTTPITAEGLSRFDTSSAFRRIFDSGDIAIYERVATGGSG